MESSMRQVLDARGPQLQSMFTRWPRSAPNLRKLDVPHLVGRRENDALSLPRESGSGPKTGYLLTDETTNAAFVGNWLGCRTNGAPPPPTPPPRRARWRGRRRLRLAEGERRSWGRRWVCGLFGSS